MQAVRPPGCPPSSATTPPLESPPTPRCHGATRPQGVVDGTLRCALQQKMQGDVGVMGPRNCGESKAGGFFPRAPGSHGTATAF